MLIADEHEVFQWLDIRMGVSLRLVTTNWRPHLDALHSETTESPYVPVNLATLMQPDQGRASQTQISVITTITVTTTTSTFSP
ncbi:hypothetical protein BH20CHL4_BH20CHL4_04310 [soil metagenome]